MRHRYTRDSYERYDRFDDPRYCYPPGPKPYGCLGFLGDVFMIMLTGGLWLIWIFIREMRRRNVRHY